MRIKPPLALSVPGIQVLNIKGVMHLPCFEYGVEYVLVYMDTESVGDHKGFDVCGVQEIQIVVGQQEIYCGPHLAPQWLRHYVLRQ
jgi:hypothetical protein